MNYIIKNQSELDNLDVNVTGNIIINSPENILIHISKKYVNAFVSVEGVSHIYASGNCVIKNASGNCVIEYAHENCVIKNAYENCVIENASGNCVVKIFDKSVKITVSQESVIICMNHKRGKGYNYIYRKTATHNIKSFLFLYNLKPIKGKIVLYKSIRADNDRDFHTNTIEYKKGVVNCPDFDTNKDRECGGGYIFPLRLNLHLNLTMEN